MKVLITGGAGYLGSMIANSLLNEGFLVDIIDNLYHRDNAHVITSLDVLHGLGLKFIKDDVSIAPSMIRNNGGYQCVIHLAALVGFPLCEQNKAEACRIHALETERIAIACKETGTRLIYFNTNSGYGTKDGEEFCTEETPMNPISVYGQTKVEGEKRIINSGLQNYVILRLATVFGSSFRMRRDLLVNNFVWRAYKDKVNVIFEGGAKRNYVHIRDVAYIAYCLATSISAFNWFKGEVYNFGDDSLNMTKLELAQLINTYIPHTIVEGSGLDPDKRNYIVSNAKIIQRLNTYTPSDTDQYNPISIVRLLFQQDFGETVHDLARVYRVIDNPVYGNY